MRLKSSGRETICMCAQFFLFSPSALHFTIQWLISIVGWLGQKSQNATKQHCLLNLRISESHSWKRYTNSSTHTYTLSPSWRLIQSQRVSFWGCCQALVCSVTLWARGNYILVQFGDSASIQRVQTVPSSYRPQPPEECPVLVTMP